MTETRQKPVVLAVDDTPENLDVVKGILAEYKAKKGNDFRWKEFNQRLVGAGSPPFFAIREYMLSED